MNFDLPPALVSYLQSLDTFIAETITPLQNSDDNIRFFDYRREYSRTDWDNGGLPRPEWEELLEKARLLADEHGFYRFALSSHPQKHLWMCAIRQHLSSTYVGGLHLANDLQTEHSIVGNFPDLLMIAHFGTTAQKESLISARLAGSVRFTFGLTEPAHGSDATWMETWAERVFSPGSTGPASGDAAGGGWRITGTKKWQTGAHRATHLLVFARTSGTAGSAQGITAFLIPRETPGVDVQSYEWTMNMPTDHATIRFSSVYVDDSAILGTVCHGLEVAQAFVHENRIRQAAGSCGAALYCVRESVRWAKQRKVFGKELARNQGVQFPLVELATQIEMLRLLILRTACEMDKVVEKTSFRDVEAQLGGKIAMCNYWANRLVCEAADRAIQVHGGMGYSRHMPFEHIYRHHRRYRITEGSEEIQMRRAAGWLFGYIGTGKKEIRTEEDTGTAGDGEDTAVVAPDPKLAKL